MNKKFTSGEWVVGYGGGISGDRAAALCYLDGTGYTQLPISVNGSMVCCVPHTEGALRATADANLISAAPELLEALERLLMYTEQYCSQYIEGVPKVEQAKAAIAKAYDQQTT